MIIIFDLLCAQPVGNMKFHGGGEYTKTVFRHVVEAAGEIPGCSLEVCYNFENFLDDWIQNLCRERQIQCHDVKRIGDINKVIHERAKADDIRFFAGMGYNYSQSNVSFPANVVSIGTFHGLRVIEKAYDREAWRYGTFKRRVHEFLDWVILKKRNLEKERIRESNALSNFDIVVTVSKHSEYSLKINFPEAVRDTRIETLYSPQKYVEITDVTTEAHQRYIMMVSADRWLKNSYRGILALDALYTKGYLKDVKTRVYGNAPEGIRKKITARHMFEFYDYVSSAELEEAYAGCEVFFYPSLNEGFGYPPLEAMKYGKTCAISGICSLPEVYGDSVYYFNPYDIMEMQNRILQAVDEKIPMDRLRSCIERVTGKQEMDLKKLVDIIVGA